MSDPVQPLNAVLVGIMYFGDVVFAVSGALTAMRHRMDLLGIVLIGTVTGIGGGTLRDVLLGQPVWWVQTPTELLLCAGSAFATFFLRRNAGGHRAAAQWADALGLAAFAIVGAHVALAAGAPFAVAAFMGMLTATGGGVIRDLLTRTQPMILSSELYATAALAGALVYAALARTALPADLVSLASFAVAFGVRAAAMVFGIRLGTVGGPAIMLRRSRGRAIPPSP